MEWPFDLSSFLFTVKDNYQLEELKGYLTEQGLAGTSGIRAVIDDRILRGTVAPIESNLSLLGAAAVGIIGQEGFRPGICAAILLCYTVGAAVAVLLTVRVNVMDILRDKE